MKQALLIAGHGSRDPEGIAEFLTLARALRVHRPDLPVEIAFLEFARPTIQEGFDHLVAQGFRQIVVVPGVLMAAGHAKNDMASEVRRARERHPDVEVHMARALEVEPRLLQLCRVRYLKAVAERPAVKPADTLLVLVGRGSSDPDANANIAKVARFLQEGYPTAWATVAFTGVTTPLLPDALLVCERLGFRRIVVQPYFLFTGVLLKRIYTQVEERRAAAPHIDYVATPHLQVHPLLLETFLERAREAVAGQGLMNCSLCQYRVAIIGHEKKQGEPQQPHHHHVQGLHHDHVYALDDHGHHHHFPEKGSTDHAWAEPLVAELEF
jgi:sirohydrochlorin cobaltochelatase